MSSGMAFDRHTVIDERTLSLLAWLPTMSFPKLTSPDFWPRLSDADMMRIAVLLAQKSYEKKLVGWHQFFLFILAPSAISDHQMLQETPTKITV